MKNHLSLKYAWMTVAVNRVFLPFKKVFFRYLPDVPVPNAKV
jgi:hypothetical protein